MNQFQRFLFFSAYFSIVFDGSHVAGLFKCFYYGKYILTLTIYETIHVYLTFFLLEVFLLKPINAF